VVVRTNYSSWTHFMPSAGRSNSTDVLFSLFGRVSAAASWATHRISFSWTHLCAIVICRTVETRLGASDALIVVPFNPLSFILFHPTVNKCLSFISAVLTTASYSLEIASTQG
jgi:hypothetical protein